MSSLNVTKTLNEKIAGTKIDVVANSSLLPMFTTGEKVELTDDDQKDISDEAEKQCGNANDVGCMNATKARLSQSKLADKEREQQSSAYLVKGRRLTVEYVDKNGKTQTAIVPEGQSFKLDGIRQTTGAPVPPGAKPELVMPSFKLPSIGGTAWEVIKIATTIIATFLYAFSIIATYRTFMQAGYTTYGYVATGVAVFIPYSGYAIMLVFFAVMAYFNSK